MARLRRALIVALVVFPAIAADAGGHDLGFTRATLVVLPGGDLRLDMIVDLDALALAAPQSTPDEELVRRLESMSPAELDATVANLERLLQRRVRLRHDGEPLATEIALPQRGTEAARSARSVLGLVARLHASITTPSGTLTVQASRAFPPLHLSVVDLRGGGASIEELDARLAEAAAASAAGTTSASGASTAARDDRLEDLVTIREILERGARSTPYPLDRPPDPPSRLDVARQYLRLGFEHIVPRGVDHILFVLGLFLLNTAWRPLLVQVSAFTVAHTLTLGLSTYGAVSLAPGIVEPLIALSIAWIAFENVVTSELKPWRPAVVFGFGLLHGLGFAGVLAELGLPRAEYLTALLSFNVGVELGQLAVIAAALVAVGWMAGREWYRDRVTVPASVAIGLVGLFWAVQRWFAA